MPRPKSPRVVDAHSAEHEWILKKLTGGKGVDPLLLAGRNIVIDLDEANGTYTIHASARGGSGGDTWPPVELDPRQSVNAGDWRYISPQSALATVGLFDLVDGVTTVPRAGLWRAIKNVPAQVVVGGITKYNVPKPPPQIGVPSGTPLKGDAEDDNCFWMPIWYYTPC